MKTLNYLFFFGGIVFQGMAQRAASTPHEYTVSPIEKVNTRASEFGPVVYGNSFLFVAPQPKDLVNNAPHYDVNGALYTDVYLATLKNGLVKSTAPFAAAAINGPYHDGPVAFNTGQTRLFLTRVEYKSGSRDFVNKAKLYEFEKKAGNWWAAAPFPHNSDNWSTGHACLSADEQLLFFSSDRPGGYGGKDLYVSRKIKNGWDVPENLGPDINSSGDESFPFLRNDGILFFSSTGHSSMGGLDIFTARNFEGRWRFLRWTGEPLNSKWDDFGITFAGPTQGYFVSNREGGAGGDDLYRFTFNYAGTAVRGRVLLTDDRLNPAKQVLVYLMNNSGTAIDSMHTDPMGVFDFSNLYNDTSYLLAVRPTDPELQGKVKFFLANDNDEVVRESQPMGADKFVFRNLPVETNLIQEIYSDDDLTLAGVLSYSTNTQRFASEIEIRLINSYGDLVMTTRTSELGSFVFKNVPHDQHYIVEIPDEALKLPDGTVVTLSDRNGKKLKQFVAGREPFRFRLLPPERFTLSELAVDENVKLDHDGCYYDLQPLCPVPRKMMYLADASNRLLDSARTNSQGFFKFNNFPKGQNCLAYFDTESGPLARTSGYYLKDKSNHMVRSAYLTDGRRHTFHNLPDDSVSLQVMKLSKRLTLAGRLHYGEHGNIPLENARVRLLDENGKVVDSVPANRYGCFIFRNLDPERSYLLDMEEEELKLPANTRVIMADCNGKVIKSFRIGKDRFEFKILPAEKNLMPDLIVSDHDLTIRLSGFIFGENRRPLAGIELTLRDSTGKMREVIRTDAQGKFTFKSLREELAAMIELAKDTSDAVLYVADSKGRIYKRIVLKNGRFTYRMIAADRVRMGEFNVDDPWLEVARIRSNRDSVTIIENIYYALNDFKFDSLGRQRIDKAVYAMRLNPNLKLEVGSHTDSRANDGYNLELSNKRARFAVDYIVSQGIDARRITGIGYGEKKLLNNCGNTTDCPEADHAKNRRTEFKLTFDATLKSLK